MSYYHYRRERESGVSDDDDAGSLDESLVNTPPDTTVLGSLQGDRDADVASGSRRSLSSTINGDVSSVPEHGGIYRIREVKSERAITLVEGRLTLVLDAGNRGGWQWRCEELHDGWIGFRDVVHGKYLGRDNKGGFYVTAGKLKNWESFVLRPREAGGYNLWVKHWDMLKAMAIVDEAPWPRLVEAQTTEEAARWEFIKVEEHPLIT